jgi:type II secretory pathway component PulJ
MNSRPIFAHRPARRLSQSTRGVKGDSPISARTKIGTVPAYGYTLVEILVALTLTLILMTTVVTVFGRVGSTMRNARRALEQFDRLRTAAQQLNTDMNGITARPDGRAGRPEEGLGYLELIEGSYLFGTNGANGTYYGVNDKNAADYTVGERGDILMFVSRNAVRPFVGRFGKDSSGNPQTIQSDVAEISWYLRGNRLHRRVLLIVPGVAPAAFAGYVSDPKNLGQLYNDYDLSVHMTTNTNGQLVVQPNSLADLVKRENRFGHDVAKGFPYEVRGWGGLGLPTLAECTSPTWMKNWKTGSTPPPAAPAPASLMVDLWDNSINGNLNKNLPDQALNSAAQDGQRVADDVVLTNVIGFDVKVWEPAANGGAGGYVDLGSTETGAQGGAVSITPGAKNPFQTPQSPSMYRFNNGGITESGLARTVAMPQAVYDSGCFSYANELGGSQATNGLADNPAGIVDVLSEYIMTTGPLAGKAPGISPYPVPLRGIQVTIRCFEPDSKQIREITIEHDFLPK